MIDLIMQSNLTTGVDSFGSIYGIISIVLMIGAAFGILSILTYISSSMEKYKRFKHLLSIIYHSTSYAAYGALTFILVVGPCIVVYHLIQFSASNAEASYEVLRWIGIIIGGYALFGGIGYFAKKHIWSKIASYIQLEEQETLVPPSGKKEEQT